MSGEGGRREQGCNLLFFNITVIWHYRHDSSEHDFKQNNGLKTANIQNRQQGIKTDNMQLDNKKLRQTICN